MSYDSGDAVERILKPETALRLLEQRRRAEAEKQAPEQAETPPPEAAAAEPAEPADEAEGPGGEDFMQMQEAARELAAGQIIKGTVIEVSDEGVLVDVGAKYEGFIPLFEFPSPSEVPQPGAEIAVAVVRKSDEEGSVVLSKKRADYENVWTRIAEAQRAGEILTAMVIERVKGGLRVDLGVPGFVPASHVAARRLRDLDRLVGRSLRLKVLEADREQKKVILSHRLVLDEERGKRREETMKKLVEGAVFEGRVRSITDYGAFVDLGGVDGLLHISEMSWTRINHPSEVVKVGQTIQVMVLKIDRERNRISLGLRQILPDPWREAAKRLRVGSVVHGKVTRVVPFGAFVQVEGGIEGIVPNTELSDRKGVESKDVVQPGQEVEVKILNIRPEERRLTLSLAQAMQEAERREYEQYMRAQRSDRPTLGDVFGDVLEERKAELEAAQKKQRRAPRRRAAKAGAEVAAAAAGAAEAPPEPQPESPAEAPAEPEPPAAEASSPAAEQVEVPEPGPEASGESAEAPAEGDETPS